MDNTIKYFYLRLCGEYAPNIESLLEMMYSQVLEEKPGAEEVCSYLLRALITLILQIPKENFVLSKSEESVLVNDIKFHIDEHYQEDITLNFLSQRFHISSYYLVHVFKKSTGFSPIQYMIRRRIGEAQSLLINTNDSITKIAGMVGYDNTSYFTKLFSKTVGMSPNKYRQLWIKN
ncbi:helix-turn-helix transcriptional regulator [Metabacillus arenae]|uniref:Helix-turn-helix transcriptional regulator n=1 Tax=Metabacillus arenae TaxID=2771434 RepID=A0A926NJ50_9BACI|nr:AraC family transcriptional regulator [Metabacillus arenae]MBD1382030.1 helix-turn-helix transcriptional regulator [Metabacillus arenae]